ncbi:kinase-like domain-containing protein [Leptodontidium sp. MPI-SDFR-AT-0119]|nr:kinase-like domain-containing protein [Leptodontidium sp. MPI-SDFR-AT-0119]
MYDEISEPPCLVFEWMDQTLAEIPPKDHFQIDALYKAVFEAGLNALAALRDENLVHADLKPDNILISGIESHRPIARIGDLRVAVEDGFNEYQVQPFAMRAPEVWQGYSCTHRSEVWSLAATVLAWAKPGILGAAALPATSRVNELTWECAKALSDAKDPDRPNRQYIEVSRFDDELRSFSDETAKMLRYLLVPDPKIRPDAASALLSSEFQALVNKAKVTEEIGVGKDINAS